MPYTPTVWVSTVTAIDAAPLNNLEIQYDQALADVLTVAETQVYNAASPNPAAWTDLDINAVVGTNEALVLFKVMLTTPAGAHDVFFRTNGDVEISNSSQGVGSVLNGVNAAFNYILCFTDTNGIVEWYYTLAADAVTIDVVAYVLRI